MFTSTLATVGIGDVSPTDGAGRTVVVLFGWILTGTWGGLHGSDKLTVVLYLQALFTKVENLITNHRKLTCLIMVLMLEVPLGTSSLTDS